LKFIQLVATVQPKIAFKYFHLEMSKWLN